MMVRLRPLPVADEESNKNCRMVKIMEYHLWYEHYFGYSPINGEMSRSDRGDRLRQ